ncbi:nucleolar protein 12 [Cynoglossus semilaevis]|uniref:Nucleolar protein 12 n=1 Tax=Cynoglossus semilaevis TaxID=244447 RepID=A0A3P8V996_CYNSE|nr:nucleolar protein 12 [Cynoglossus semilaevis]
MKNNKKHNNGPKKAKFKPGSKKRENKCIVTFNDNDREEYLTGFHKRKVQRRKVALAEIRKKIKDEQIKVREERHKEYVKMLKERTEALNESEDELDDVIISTSESMQYDHPNHTVTVTTISDLDLSATHLLDSAANQDKGPSEEQGEEEKEKTAAMPRKAGTPVMNNKIRSLMSSLNRYTTKRKRKGKQEGRRGHGSRTDGKHSGAELKKKKGTSGMFERRRRTGQRERQQD